MSSPASSATWLPLAVARAAVVDAPPAQRVPAVGRHAAPEVPGLVEIVAAERLRPGRHAEGEWSREVFDPQSEIPWPWSGPPRTMKITWESAELAPAWCTRARLREQIRAGCRGHR